MAVAIALDVVTLTSAPALFLDEAFTASRLQSFGAGGDFFPALATDYGIYEGGADPNQNPSDPAEHARLERLLDREYALVREVETDGREISFWRRAAPSCPPPG